MLKIQKITGYDILKAENKLPFEYRESLKNKPTFYESLVARYEIFTYENILPQVSLEGVPIFENEKYWSIAHKKDIIFVATGSHPLGVDIEIIQSRGSEIYSLHQEKEYELFGGKNQENFYMLWVVKESVIKLYLTSLDEKEYIIFHHLERKNIMIEGIEFQYMILGNFQNHNFKSYIGKNTSFIWSISMER